MDKWVCVKFYRIIKGKGANEPFSSHIEAVHKISEQQRERVIDHVPYWIDKIKNDAGLWSGRFCRKQSGNLPPRAEEGIQLAPLGVPAIGQTAAWIYDPITSVLVFEATQGGVGTPQFFRYMRNVCSCRGYAARPAIGIENLARLRDGRIRSLVIKIACPQDLQAVTPTDMTVASGLRNMMSANVGTQIEVKFSLAVGDPDIPRSRVRQVLNWLRSEKQAERGDIKKLEAGIIDEDGNAQGIDFLEAHMAERTEIDIPDDDPDLAYDRRNKFAVSVFKKRQLELRDLFN